MLELPDTAQPFVSVRSCWAPLPSDPPGPRPSQVLEGKSDASREESRAWGRPGPGQVLSPGSSPEESHRGHSGEAGQGDTSPHAGGCHRRTSQGAGPPVPFAWARDKQTHQGCVGGGWGEAGGVAAPTPSTKQAKSLEVFHLLPPYLASKKQTAFQQLLTPPSHPHTAPAVLRRTTDAPLTGSPHLSAPGICTPRNLQGPHT